MATKVYDSPTMNIFALLAEEHTVEPQSKKTKGANASSGPVAELTPKERAEAKAVQDAARKAQREAEKAKQEAEAARRKALELIDDTGFAPQRHQRIKENRLQERNAPEVPKSPKSPKAKGKEWDETGSDKGKKGKGAGWDNKGGSAKETKVWDNKGVEKGAKSADGKPAPKDWDNKGKGPAGNKVGAKGNKPGWEFSKGVAGDKKDKPKTDRPPKEGKGNHRQGFDKHSQGVTSRHHQPKKAGHGKANWDETVPAGLNAAPVQEALASEALAAPATGEVDGWGETTTPANAEGSPATDADAPAEKDAAGDKKKEEDDEDANKKTLDDFLADQEQKRLALEAKIGGLKPARELSDEEKKALTKFTLVENSKVVKKPEPKTTTPKTVATGQPAARKGEKPAEENLLSFRVAGARTGARRGGRFEGSPPPRDNTGRGGPRKAGRGPQKILKGKNEFPDLGK